MNPKKIIKLAVIFSLIFLSEGISLSSEKVPQFEISNLSGETLSFKTWENRIVLLDFWATWCKSCRKSWGELKEIENKYHSRGLEVLGVSVDVSKENVKKFSKNYKIPKKFIALDTQNIARQFFLVGIPMTLLIADGDIIFRHYGPLSFGRDKLEEKLTQHFKNKKKKKS